MSETALASLSGLPPQIQRNFWKAAGRVLTAGAEWPAAFLESKARIAGAKAGVEIARFEMEQEQLRSQQNARTLVDVASAKVAARAFQNERGLADRAVEYHAAHILREQQRREDILCLASEEIKNGCGGGDTDSDVDEDVIETILREGSQRSSDSFKALFARLLAGEIERPGTFSINTIRALGGMSQSVAQLFQVACNLSTIIPFLSPQQTPPRLVTYDSKAVGEGALKRFGLDYNDAMQLVEAGLLRPELNETVRIRDAFVETSMFECGGKRFFLTRMPTYAPKADSSNDAFSLKGPSFTQIGAELRRIVVLVHSTAYMQSSVNWFAHNKLFVNEVVGGANGVFHGRTIPAD